VLGDDGDDDRRVLRALRLVNRGCKRQHDLVEFTEGIDHWAAVYVDGELTFLVIDPGDEVIE
jgi:hypothetical protein